MHELTLESLLEESPTQQSLFQESLYSHSFKKSSDAILIHGLQGEIFDANPKAEELLGYPREELVRLRIDDLNPTHSRHRSRRASQQIRERGFVHFSLELRRKSGALFPAEVTASLYEVAGRHVIQSNLRDISHHRQAEDRLRRSALYDTLTDLPNRALFRERLSVAIGRAQRRTADRFAVLALGLDRFKTVNDSLGHPMGDRLLRALADRLATCIRDGDTLARLGGDEFAVLVSGIQGVIDARQAAERIEHALASPFDIAGKEIYASASIGIVLGGPPFQNPDDCLRDADIALFHAKSMGGGRQVFFRPAMRSRAQEQLDLVNTLRQAAINQEFRLHYQPIIDLKSGEIVELEALVRWQHPDRGLLPPSEFLPLAEETGETAVIDEWVLRQACRQLHEWQTRYPGRTPHRVAVNVSSRQFTRLEWVLLVEEVLKEHNLSPENLRLEVTENAMIDSPNAAIEMLSRFKRMHLEVSLDDFGTGYSSLSYLHRFPVDTLKIDRSFVNASSQGSAIIETVVLLGHKLGMKVTAEGIETAADLRRIRALKCEQGQGYLFSRPLDAQAIMALIETRPCW